MNPGGGKRRDSVRHMLFSRTGGKNIYSDAFIGDDSKQLPVRRERDYIPNKLSSGSVVFNNSTPSTVSNANWGPEKAATVTSFTNP